MNGRVAKKVRRLTRVNKYQALDSILKSACAQPLKMRIRIALGILVRKWR